MMLEALSLSLACPGSFDVKRSRVTPSAHYAADGQVSYSYSNDVTRSREDGFIRIVISNGQAQLNGYWNENDWNPVENLTITDSEIAGDARVKKSKIRSFKIDRATGRIKIGTFTGQCEAYDPGQRKF